MVAGGVDRHREGRESFDQVEMSRIVGWNERYCLAESKYICCFKERELENRRM